MDNHEDRFSDDDIDCTPSLAATVASSIRNDPFAPPEYNPYLNAVQGLYGVQPLPVPPTAPYATPSPTDLSTPPPPTAPPAPAPNDTSLPEFPRAPSTPIPRPKKATSDGASPSKSQEEMASSQMVASGTAGAVIGLLVGGPVLAALGGFGLAYASTKSSGATGDVARAAGDVALFVRFKARELDAKHHLIDKLKKALVEGWEQAKEMNRKHKIVEQFQDFVRFSWHETVGFTRRHRLLERGVERIGSGISFVSQQVFQTENDSNGNSVANCGNDKERKHSRPAAVAARPY